MSINPELKSLYRSSKFLVLDDWHPNQSFKTPKFATVFMITNTIMLECENESRFPFILLVIGYSIHFSSVHDRREASSMFMVVLIYVIRAHFLLRACGFEIKCDRVAAVRADM